MSAYGLSALVQPFRRNVELFIAPSSCLKRNFCNLR